MERLKSEKFEEHHISGEQAERLFIGDAKSTLKYEEYKNHAMQALQSGSSVFENRNNKAVMKKHIALADALNIDFAQATRHEEPRLSAFAEGINTGLQSIDENYRFVPTGARPVDFDYGADAIIHNGKSLEELKDIARGKLPYTSIGITLTNKKAQSLTQGKNKISSDLEIHIPSNEDIVRFIGDKDLFKLAEFVKEIIARSHQIHTLKQAGDNIDVLDNWISYEDFLKR